MPDTGCFGNHSDYCIEMFEGPDTILEKNIRAVLGFGQFGIVGECRILVFVPSCQASGKVQPCVDFAVRKMGSLISGVVCGISQTTAKVEDHSSIENSSTMRRAGGPKGSRDMDASVHET